MNEYANTIPFSKIRQSRNARQNTSQTPLHYVTALSFLNFFFSLTPLFLWPFLSIPKDLQSVFSSGFFFTVVYTLSIVPGREKKNRHWTTKTLKL